MTARQTLGTSFQQISTDNVLRMLLKSQKYFVAQLVITRTLLSSCLSKNPSLGMFQISLSKSVCFGSKTGLTTVLVSKNLPPIQRSWRHEARCTAMLFDKTIVMAVYDSDSDKDWEQYEACVCVL